MGLSSDLQRIRVLASETRALAMITDDSDQRETLWTLAARLMLVAEQMAESGRIEKQEDTGE